MMQKHQIVKLVCVLFLLFALPGVAREFAPPRRGLSCVSEGQIVPRNLLNIINTLPSNISTQALSVPATLWLYAGLPGEIR